MRISDWSSDVCSSDLGQPPDRTAPVEGRKESDARKAMNDKQVPSEANRRRRLLSLRTAAALAAAALLTACAALQEEDPSAEPSRVSTEGATDEFPNLAEVPPEPRAHSAPEERATIIEELAAARSAATFTAPEPPDTPAPPHPFAPRLTIHNAPLPTSHMDPPPPNTPPTT